jgi:hypothetical protein
MRYDYVLYCPEIVDYDAQFNYGVKRVMEGSSVWLHGHSIRETCTPNGATRGCGQLTLGVNGATLVSDSKTATQSDN